MHPFSTTKSLALVGAVLATLLPGIHPYGERVSDLPLFASATVHCDEMITLHRWEGTCCSLNVTSGNGCILNVMNGYCKVTGQVWTLDYNSTYDVPCPASEYTNDMLGMKVTGLEEEESGGATAALGLAGAAAAAATVWAW